MTKPIDLKDGILVLKICLKKSWSKKASYWVEVWQVPQKLPQKTLTRWVFNRSWAFTRKTSTGHTENIEGSVPGEPSSSFYTALDSATEIVSSQIERDYTIDVIRNYITGVVDPRELCEMTESILKSVNSWSKQLNKPLPVILEDGSSYMVDPGGAHNVSGVINEPCDGSFANHPRVVPPKTGFKAAQARRAKKARW